jgi:broad specificity phosphatase PhoE
MDGPPLPPLSPTVKRLFLVRHGQVINPGGNRAVYYGAQDVPLSAVGQQEATRAAQYLAQFALHAVFTSPLSRALYGAQQVVQLQQQHDAVPVTIEDFCELNRGAWCGLTKAEIGAQNLARFDAGDESVTPAGGESYAALQRRVLAALRHVLSQVPLGSCAAIVSHLQVTRCIVADALSLPTSALATLPIATASITCIDYNDDGVAKVHFQSFKPGSTDEAAAMDGAN